MSKRTINADELYTFVLSRVRPEDEDHPGDFYKELDAAFPLAEPAHENPRVVAAAVEMVKEVEQHTAKAAKDREDWLAQFPGWVREWCADDDKIVPLRCGETWVLYADAGTVKWGRSDWFGLHYREASPGNQFVGRLIDFADDLNLPLYADGNVPLWGDVFRYETDGGGWATAGRIDGSRVYSDKGYWWDASDLALLRRHPAIADLPGIRNDSSEDQAGSNDSGDEVTTSPIKVTGVNRPEPEYDPDDVAFKAPKVALREGQRVTCEARYPNSVGFLVDCDPGSGRLDDRNTVCFGGTTWDTFRDDELTPIPPPLIDNGDGTWTMEGYGMFFVQRSQWGWRWVTVQPPHNGGEVRSTPTAAAEDLWRRMEGVR